MGHQHSYPLAIPRQFTQQNTQKLRKQRNYENKTTHHNFYNHTKEAIKLTQLRKEI